MAKIRGLKAKVEAHPRYSVPGRVFDIETKPSKQDPALIAESMLKKIARNLKINPDLSQLKFDQVKQSILGSHVLYQQYHGAYQSPAPGFRASRHSPESKKKQQTSGRAFRGNDQQKMKS